MAYRRRRRPPDPEQEFRRMCYQLHAIARAEERYGLKLRRKDVEAIGREFVEGRAVPLGDAPSASNRIVAAVRWRGVRFPLVWDRTDRCVVTFLRPDAFPDDQESAIRPGS